MCEPHGRPRMEISIPDANVPLRTLSTGPESAAGSRRCGERTARADAGGTVMTALLFRPAVAPGGFRPGLPPIRVAFDLG